MTGFGGRRGTWGRACALVLLLIGFGVAGVHCGNKVGGGDAPVIEVQPSPQIVFNHLALGQSQAELVTVTNRGNVTLTVRKIAISGGGGAFDQQGITQLPFTVKPGEIVTFQVVYQQIDENDKTADLIIESNDPTRNSLTIKLLSSKPRPRLDVAPNPIEFTKRTDPGNTAQLEVLMKNVGTADLKISKISRQGDPAFSIVFPVGSPFTDISDDGKPGTNPEALVLSPNQIYKFIVIFKPEAVGEATGKVIIYTNDDTLNEGKKIVPIIANSKGPCLWRSPPRWTSSTRCSAAATRAV